jgi:peroxiredoxin
MAGTRDGGGQIQLQCCKPEAKGPHMTLDKSRQALLEAFNMARSMDAPINERLAIISTAFRAHFPNYAKAVDELVTRLMVSGAGASAPQVGDAMPPFLLPDERGHLGSLDDLLALGPAVIAFHRGHWCPYCRTNAHALNQIHHRITASGGQLVAVTPESEKFTRAQQADAQASFPVFSDINHGYALTLNLAIWIGDDLRSVLQGFGRDLPAYHGNASWFLPIPATFVVASDGTVHARFVDPDYRRRMDLEAVIAAVRSAG